MTKNELKLIAKKKAQQSECLFRVSAIGLNKRGEIVGSAINRYKHREKDRGQIHAEISLIHNYGKKISTIIICRVGRKGDILPIHACENCQKVADAMNIKIETVWEWQIRR